jgi:hypothetical protein
MLPDKKFVNFDAPRNSKCCAAPRMPHSRVANRLPAALMHFLEKLMTSAPATWTAQPTLHVFEQEGGWHWGITVPRSRESPGFRVVAFSFHIFDSEGDARADGDDALARTEFSGGAD